MITDDYEIAVKMFTSITNERHVIAFSSFTPVDRSYRSNHDTCMIWRLAESAYHFFDLPLNVINSIGIHAMRPQSAGNHRTRYIECRTPINRVQWPRRSYQLHSHCRWQIYFAFEWAPIFCGTPSWSIHAPTSFWTRGLFHSTFEDKKGRTRKRQG